MENQEDVFKETIKLGLILGFIQISVSVLFYLTDISLLLGMKGQGSQILIVAITVVFFAIRIRTLQGGLMTFREGFKTVFLIGLVGALLNTVFIYVLYNFIDTTLSEQYKQITIDSTREMMEKFGAGGEQLDKALEQLETQDFSFSLGTMLQGLVVSSLLGACYAAIVGASIKKENNTF